MTTDRFACKFANQAIVFTVAANCWISRSRRVNSLADHFFIFKAAPSKVVTMASAHPW
jgi:hypothetical protein